MSMPGLEDNGASTRINCAGQTLAILQLVFTLGWTNYAIFLPKLAAGVGIAPSLVIFILLLDQAIFTLSDTAMGVAADKVASLGRLGLYIGSASVLSCTAFALLPFVVGTEPGARIWFIGAILIWAITSSTLRAPPLALLGKHCERSLSQSLSAFAAFGYGLAGAVSPYMGLALRDADARLPFVISSLVLLVTVFALARAERGLKRESTPTGASGPTTPLGKSGITFIAATAILALGYQVHFGVNSAQYFLRFAEPDDLPWLMPIFWIGFNIAVVPATIAAKRWGEVFPMGVAALFGAIAMLCAGLAEDLDILIAAELLAGAAWGCMLMGAISSALAIGHGGAQGKVVGLVFSALAVATFARIAATVSGLQKSIVYAPLFHWAPVACWFVAGIVLLAIAPKLRAKTALTR